MKSLDNIIHDNRMSNRDFGGMCSWFVFNHGDLLGCFVEESNAREFASTYEYEHSDSDVTITAAR